MAESTILRWPEGRIPVSTIVFSTIATIAPIIFPTIISVAPISTIVISTIVTTLIGISHSGLQSVTDRSESTKVKLEVVDEIRQAKVRKCRKGEY